MPYDVTASTTSSAPAEVVFDHLAIAGAWRVWGNFSGAERERDGVGTPDGVGAVRRLRIGPGGAREETVVYEPHRRYGYRLLSGLPVVGYHSDVLLDPTPSGGTSIRWDGRFQAAKIPGTNGLFRSFLGWMIGRLATDVARHCDSCADPSCPAYRSS